MDVKRVIEKMETGEQDTVLMALQSYNKEMSQIFTFITEDEQDRQYLGELVLAFLNKDVQPCCQLTCLETVRILTRDKNCLSPFVSRSALSTLARYAEEREAAEGAEELEEHPDQDAVMEGLKSICNVLLHSETGLAEAADLQLIEGVTSRLKQSHQCSRNHEILFFDLRLTFLLTAQRVEIRKQLAQELHGISLLGNQLEAVLGLCWPDTLEAARSGFEGVPLEELPPLSRQQTELAMEVLKILFNITFDKGRRSVDEEEAAEFRRLAAILRHCLMIHTDGDEGTQEFHSHVVNLLGNLPLPCLDVLLIPKVQQGSTEYLGVNMDAVDMLLNFMEKRLDRGQKLKETLLPSLNLLIESSRIHRETRKFLRSKVLPPLRDVKNRPEVGDALRNKLVRLMTHVDTDVKDAAAEFLFVLCKENVSRFIKYTGYGNAAGLLVTRGLLAGGRGSGFYSDDEDSDTEEYREAKTQINPVTGVVEEEQPDPMEGMTEEQKEYEAIKLIKMFEKLSRTSVIQPMQLGTDGKMRAMKGEDLHNLAQNPAQLSANSGSEDEPDEAEQPH
ncbi:chaperone Ric-8A isoform X2 [Takifugu rubripes]|uniref:chaperone Ric-8A isoform X2 n=1 Tax=Takifugu rubripes TaxID=31033 RepID=UPI001145F670|nr:synembryn-A-like isoform X2 [Takifugu rubripes]